MHIRGLIIEGHSHSGKTSLINLLKKKLISEKDSERNIIILGEHYSQILNLVNGKLESKNANEHLEILNRRVEMLTELNDYAVEMGPASRRSRGIFFILERFHLCHRANFDTTNNSFIEQIERKLIGLGAHCVLLHTEENLEERVKSRSVEEWKGKTDDDVKEYVESMKLKQKMYIEHAQSSAIPTTIINTDEKKWDDYATKILKSINIV